MNPTQNARLSVFVQCNSLDLASAPPWYTEVYVSPCKDQLSTKVWAMCQPASPSVGHSCTVRKLHKWRYKSCISPCATKDEILKLLSALGFNDLFPFFELLWTNMPAVLAFFSLLLLWVKIMGEERWAGLQERLHRRTGRLRRPRTPLIQQL